MEKQIRDIAKQRVEQVWQQDSPLNSKYNILSCELCHKDINEAVCMPVGYSWRSGWVFLCKQCYLESNYWADDDEKLEIMYDRYCVKVT